jgi:transposase
MEGINLAEEERIVLKNHCKKSPIALIRFKAMAINMRYSGLKISQIATAVYSSERTVKRWLSNFRKRRLSSLFSGKEENENASKLTKDQKKEVEKVLNSKPSDRGLPAEFWDIPTLKKYVKANFKIVYESPKSYYLLMEFANLSFKYPDTFDFHRDEEAIVKRIKEIKKEIKKYKKDPNWLIVASDEVRIVLEAYTRKAWLKKGERTVIKVNRRREHQNYIGFLDLKGKKVSVIELNWQNQEEIIPALEEYAKMNQGKKICLIWDNVAFHKGKVLRKELGSKGRLHMYHLINFPPYAPDHNPIEKVWNWGKGKISNKQFEDFQTTKENFVKAIGCRKFSYLIK